MGNNNTPSSTLPGGIIHDMNNESEAKCPFISGSLEKTAGGGLTNRDWWPNQLK